MFISTERWSRGGGRFLRFPQENWTIRIMLYNPSDPHVAGVRRIARPCSSDLFSAPARHRRACVLNPLESALRGGDADKVLLRGRLAFRKHTVRCKGFLSCFFFRSFYLLLDSILKCFPHFALSPLFFSLLLFELLCITKLIFLQPEKAISSSEAFVSEKLPLTKRDECLRHLRRNCVRPLRERQGVRTHVRKGYTRYDLQGIESILSKVRNDNAITTSWEEGEVGLWLRVGVEIKSASNFFPVEQFRLRPDPSLSFQVSSFYSFASVSCHFHRFRRWKSKI